MSVYYQDPDGNGVEVQEIHRKARAGDYLPGEIPPDIFLPELY
jgi:hypothetical protein